MKTNKFYILLNIIAVIAAASCAKENLPSDPMRTSSYGSLYMVQSGEIFVKNALLFSNTGTTNDTVIKAYSAALGGGNVVNKNLPVKFKVDNTLLDSFNAKMVDSLKAKILPEGSYEIVENSTIPSGSTQTSVLPIKIKVNQLAIQTNYVLPIRFYTDDNTYPLDSARTAAYFTFRTLPSYKGKMIGYIPQGADPKILDYTDPLRPMIFDFFGDIMVKDRSGNLIIYPLESNSNPDKLGDPDTLVKGADISALKLNLVSHMFFNPDTSSLYAFGYTGALQSYIIRYPVTKRTATQKASISPYTTVIYYSGLYGWYSFWMGYGNTFFGSSTGGSAALYNFNGKIPTTNVRISRGVSETQWVSWAVVNDANVANHPDGLKIWPNVSNVSGAIPLTSGSPYILNGGKNFFNYYNKFGEIYRTDFFAIRKTGEVIRWKNFDQNGWYDGNDYDK